MGWLDFYKQKSIKSKMHLYIGASVALIMLVSFSFYIITLRNNTRDAATKVAEEQIKGYSNQIVGIINQAYGFSESLASSVAFMANQQIPNREAILQEQLTTSAANNTNYSCIWVSLEHSAITPGYTKSIGRRSYLTIPLSDIPYMSVDKDLDSFDPKTLYYVVKNGGKQDIKEPYYYNYYNNSSQEMLITTVGYPVIAKDKTIGVAGIDIPLDGFQKIVEKISITPGTFGFLVSKSGFIAAHTDKKIVGKNFDKVFGNDSNVEFSKLISSNAATHLYTKINDEEYYTVLMPIKMGNSTNWLLGVSVPSDEIFAESKKSVFWAIIVCLLGIGFTTYVINLLAKRITAPLVNLTNSIKRLSKGEVSEEEKLDVKSGDEMEDIADSLNFLVDGLNKTAKFAQEIGNGNLKAEHNLLGDKDVLGKSLEEMRSSLIKANEQEYERKKEEEKTNWANQCYAQVSELLRKNNDNIYDLSHSIVSNLVKFLEINQGGMFILTEDTQEEPRLDMTACYAYNRRKMMEKSFAIGEGLVGRCYVEGETIFLLEIPENYINITSGLGDTPPSCLLLVPLKINNEINGVLEFASLTPIEEYKVKFVEKIAESIASTIASVRINIHTSELLAQTRQQAEEMAAQEEEMRQNLEELQSTQEEMARVQEEQRKFQEALNHEKMLFSNFLDNVPESVYFKDKQSRLIRFSKSLAKVHGRKIEDLIGKTDFDLFGYGEHSQKAYNDEQNIINTGVPIFDLVEREDREDGRVTWVTTNKMPLKDVNGEIVGTFGISKDFSRIKELENNLVVERSLFRVLLDTSEEMIYFKDANGKYLKANKAKYEHHGFTSKDEIIGKTDLELFGAAHFEQSLKEEQEIIRTGEGYQSKEVSIVDLKGKKKWYLASKLPIRDFDGNIIGTLGIKKEIKK